MLIRFNRLFRNDVGALLEGAPGVRVLNNEVRDSSDDGISLSTSQPFDGGLITTPLPTTDALIERNNVRKSVSDGIVVQGDLLNPSVDNTFLHNTSFENGEFDCRDDTTDGNVWIDNRGRTSSPPNLCTTGQANNSSTTTTSTIALSASAVSNVVAGGAVR